MGGKPKQEGVGRAYGTSTYGLQVGVKREEWLVVWGLAYPPHPPNPRLSPEIYLKRPAYSDDWRLDIMLKKKAVRRVFRLEGRCGGGCLWVEVS